MRKKNEKAKTKSGLSVTISDKVKYDSNDPFVIKKGEEADKFLKKHGFPEKLLKKRYKL